jgi:peptidoglycan/LPS O-acetylase OafA/YrhL
VSTVVEMSMNPGEATPPRSEGFPFVDALRAVAAFLVLVYHVIVVGEFDTFPSAGGLDTFRIGWIGVDFFLVISGFVIAHSAFRDFAHDEAGFRKRFFRKRLARIVPLYAFTCVVFLFLVDPAPLGRAPHLVFRNLAMHALFLHNLLPGTHGSINGVTWSLGLEMQFYVAMVFATPWLVRIRARTALLVLVSIALVYRVVVFHIPMSGDNLTHKRFIFLTQLPGTLDAFGIGIALAIAVARGPEWVKRCLTPGWRSFLPLATLAALAFTATMSVFWRYGTCWDLLGMATLWRTMLAVSFGLVLAAAITFPLAAAKAFAPIRYLGEVSYGIYLWHMMVLDTLDPMRGMDDGRLLAWTIVGAVTLASLSYHMLEKPMIEAGKRAS